MGEKKIGEGREPRISMRRGKDGGNVTVVYHRRVQEKLDDILNASFLYLTSHKHIFCSSWSQGISENSRKEICIACSKSMFKNRSPNIRSVILKERDTFNRTANLST